jgi:diguanylate cyclase (GGDEF)-like protein
MVAQVLTKTLKRASDFAARWGGEEFTVLLPNTNTKGGLAIAEQIRKNVEAMKLSRDNGEITRLTISIGVNTRDPIQVCSIDQFISKADTALYEAKNAGRNKVCVYVE